MRHVPVSTVAQHFAHLRTSSDPRNVESYRAFVARAEAYRMLRVLGPLVADVEFDEPHIATAKVCLQMEIRT